MKIPTILTALSFSVALFILAQQNHQQEESIRSLRTQIAALEQENADQEVQLENGFKSIDALWKIVASHE